MGNTIFLGVINILYIWKYYALSRDFLCSGGVSNFKDLEKSNFLSEWVQYLLVSVVVKVYKHREPFYLYLYLNETLYTVIRKTLMGHFYDKSKGKMGRQKIWNKLKFLDGIFLDWIRIDFSTNGLHRTLKKAYF